MVRIDKETTKQFLVFIRTNHERSRSAILISECSVTPSPGRRSVVFEAESHKPSFIAEVSKKTSLPPSSNTSSDGRDYFDPSHSELV